MLLCMEIYPNTPRNDLCCMGNDTERAGSNEYRPAVHELSAATRRKIAKTAGCRLRFMLEEKRKGKMKN